MKITQADRVRFFSKVDRSGSHMHCCQPWCAAVSDTGYGQFWFRGKMIGAHVFAWIVEHGSEPADCVLHTCDNRRCVNPLHLFAGTRADNNRDCAEKGRTADRSGEKNTQAKLTEQQVTAIHTRYRNGGITQREIAKRYGVTQQAIGDILRGRNWPKVASSFGIVFAGRPSHVR